MQSICCLDFFCQCWCVEKYTIGIKNFFVVKKHFTIDNMTIKKIAVGSFGGINNTEKLNKRKEIFECSIIPESDLWNSKEVKVKISLKNWEELYVYPGSYDTMVVKLKEWRRELVEIARKYTVSENLR